MDNQENETFTGNTGTLPEAPMPELGAEGIGTLRRASLAILHEDAARDRWLSSLQSMPLADLAAELSEEGALRYRGLLWRAHEAMQAFTDPEGNMPEQTGEFLELKLIMLELEAALGVKEQPTHQPSANPKESEPPWLNKSYPTRENMICWIESGYLVIPSRSGAGVVIEDILKAAGIKFTMLAGHENALTPDEQ